MNRALANLARAPRAEHLCLLAVLMIAAVATGACGGMNAVCGDGTVDSGEECDDGNTADGDGCSSTCMAETPVCGDGTVDPGEDCDDGNTVDGDGCSSTCMSEAPVCGDGTVDPGEDCDGMNLDGNDCTTIGAGFTGGTLTCGSTCAFDTTGCTGGTLSCADVCPLVITAGCANGPPTIPDCEMGCADAMTTCPTEFAALSACAGPTPNYMCSAIDVPYPDGCLAESDALIFCLQTLSCADVCPLVIAAGCANGPTTIPDCEMGCTDASMACPAEFDALALCTGVMPTFTCDVNGVPHAQGCQTESDALLACLP